MAPQIPQQVVALARRQHRIVTRAQLLALGLNPDAIKRSVRGGWLHREHPGVYSVGTPATTPLERAAAAVLACGRGAALAEQSALGLWGLRNPWPAQPRLVAPTDRRPSGLVVHRTTKLVRADIRTHLGIRVTSMARTVLDCAPTQASKQLTRTVNDALRSPFLSAAQLADVCARNPRHRGTKLLLPFVDAGHNPTRSAFEDLFPSFCERFGLPSPLVNVIVCGYEVDAYFPEHGVIVELDGWDFHRDRRSFENDRNRDADTLAAGLVTVRITWVRFTTGPEHEAERLRAILDWRLAVRGRSARAAER
jgi:hypothetical protein